jgi:hypothetical protein
MGGSNDALAVAAVTGTRVAPLSTRAVPDQGPQVVVPVGATRARHQYFVPEVSPDAVACRTPSGTFVAVEPHTTAVKAASVATSNRTSEFPPAVFDTSTRNDTAVDGIRSPFTGARGTAAYWEVTAAAVKRNAGKVPVPAPSRFVTG